MGADGIRAIDIRKNVNCLRSYGNISLPEIIWFADVPILERDRPAISHPEKSSFLGLVGARGPKMLVTETEVLDMLLESIIFLLRSYTRQMHPVITTVLRGSVPVCLRRKGGMLIFHPSVSFSAKRHYTKCSA